MSIIMITKQTHTNGRQDKVQMRGRYEQLGFVKPRKRDHSNGIIYAQIKIFSRKWDTWNLVRFWDTNGSHNPDAKQDLVFIKQAKKKKKDLVR